MSSPTTAISDSDLIDGLDVWYLKLFGLWGIVNHYRITGRRNAVFKLLFITDSMFDVPSIIFQYFMVYFYVPVDMQKFTIINSHIVPCLHVFIRFIIFWFRLGSISKLFNLFKRDFLTTIPESKRFEVGEMYKDVSHGLNLLVKSVLSCGILLIILWVFFPCYPVDYIEHETGKLEIRSGTRFKILGGWYPFPMSKSPYYECILIYEGLLVSWHSVMAATFLCMFYEPLICLSTHFRVLSHHIATLKVGEEYENGGSASSDIYKQLYFTLQDHRKLLRYANELKKVYNPAVTVTLAMSIYMQVICVFQILCGGISDTVYILKFMQLISYVVFEVSMFCYGSTLLEEASSELTLAVYSSEWYKADLHYRKMALMLMMGARKGITLTAIKMYPVNLETVVNIFQFTYTVATLMSRMAE